jgi:hypothetical protein
LQRNMLQEIEGMEKEREDAVREALRLERVEGRILKELKLK